MKVDDQGMRRLAATPKNFLFHHGTLVEVYKAKLADDLRACGLYDAVPAEAWQDSSWSTSSRSAMAERC